MSFSHSITKQMATDGVEVGGALTITNSSILAVDELIANDARVLSITTPRWDGSRLKSLWVSCSGAATLTSNRDGAGATSNQGPTNWTQSTGSGSWHNMAGVITVADVFNDEGALGSSTLEIGTGPWDSVLGTWTIDDEQACTCSTPATGLNLALLEGLADGSFQSRTVTPNGDGDWRYGVAFRSTEDGSSFLWAALERVSNVGILKVYSVTGGVVTQLDGGYDGPANFGGDGQAVTIQVLTNGDAINVGVNLDTQTMFNCGINNAFNQTETFCGIVVQNDTSFTVTGAKFNDFIATNGTNSNTQAQLIVLRPAETSALLIGQVAMSIPPGVAVVGVMAEINCHGGDASQTITSAKVVKNSAIIGTGLAGTPLTINATTDTYLTAGGASDLGGTTLLRSDVNNVIPTHYSSVNSGQTGAFGVGIIVANNSATTRAVHVSNIRFTVYYAPMTPSSLTLVEGKPYEWQADGYFACAFPEDIEAGFTLTKAFSSDDGDASFSLRALVEASPP